MCLLQGETDSAISQKMGIVETTVRNQVVQLCKAFEIEKSPVDPRSKRSKLLLLFAQYRPDMIKEDLRLPIPSSPGGIEIERPKIEKQCYEEIHILGALLRIKAPHKMGKSWLLTRIFQYAKKQCGYKTAVFPLLLETQDELRDLDKLTRSLCKAVRKELDLKDEVDNSWDEDETPNRNCINYFERYILPNIDAPLVLGLDDVDRIFPEKEVYPDFFAMLRGWYELRQYRPIWQKLRLVLVYSTEVYISLSIEQSPFNVGREITLPEFNLEQVKELARRNGLKWDENKAQKLMEVVGGYPYLVMKAFNYLKTYPETDLEEFLAKAPTEEGIYRDRLLELLQELQKNDPDHQKLQAMKKIVNSSDGPVAVESKLLRQLDRLGLIRIEGNKAIPRNHLYKQYFHRCLNKEESATK